MSVTYRARDRVAPRPDLHVLCYGAGAIGMFLAARFAFTGATVTLLGRPKTMDELRANGLALETGGQTLLAMARYVTSVDEVASPPDYVFLAVKSYDTAAALPDLTRLVAMGATVCTVQNGVGNEQVLVDALGAAHVLSGAITVSASVPEPGLVVQHTGAGGLAFAPVPGGPTPGTLLTLCDEASLPAVGVASAADLKWSKLLLNILANAQAAILDTDAATIAGDPALFAIEQRAFREALRVMRRVPARPIMLPGYDVPKLAQAMRLPRPLAWRLLRGRIGGGRGDKRPSLALDLARGRTMTEVDWLNGAVAQTAARHGLTAPVNTTLTRLVRQLATDPAACPPLPDRRAWLLRALRQHAKTGTGD